eukprot:187768-Pyramimonas_sp.AAC.1
MEFAYYLDAAVEIFVGICKKNQWGHPLEAADIVCLGRESMQEGANKEGDSSRPQKTTNHDFCG